MDAKKAPRDEVVHLFRSATRSKCTGKALQELHPSYVSSFAVIFSEAKACRWCRTLAPSKGGIGCPAHFPQLLVLAWSMMPRSQCRRCPLPEGSHRTVVALVVGSETEVMTPFQDGAAAAWQPRDGTLQELPCLPLGVGSVLLTS